MIHIALHLLIPLVIAVLFYPRSWKYAVSIMLLTMLVDIDHLLADPIYDPSRCSIGFHPFHKLEFILIYCLFLLFPKTRLLGLGLSIHMVLDSIDCKVTNNIWFQ